MIRIKEEGRRKATIVGDIQDLDADIQDPDRELVDALHRALNCTEAETGEFIRVVLEDIKTFDTKQRDYGRNNIADFGEFGVLVRANDKMARLKNLLGRGKPAANESVEDSWRDLSVYGVIARLCRRGLW